MWSQQQGKRRQADFLDLTSSTAEARSTNAGQRENHSLFHLRNCHIPTTDGVILDVAPLTVTCLICLTKHVLQKSTTYLLSFSSVLIKRSRSFLRLSAIRSFNLTPSTRHPLPFLWFGCGQRFGFSKPAIILGIRDKHAT